MLPLLVYFVFKGKLDATSTYLTSVNEQKGDFIWSKRLFSDYVIYDWLRFVVILSWKSA